ncbi:hypothetical protein ACIBI9_40045 [Nonomuraea sp. NPDC050451]|uniref:hypothetical protein n=1 Tax=Nonomuraea sp. NPDC050451 TaxID=3364364 RepID=UPI0037AC899C
MDRQGLLADAGNMGVIREQLLALHSSTGEVIQASAANMSASIGRLVRLELDVQVYEEMISSRPESSLLRDARKEFGYATYAASSGLYRLAYDGVRLFLELSFASVYFSANELQRRKWLSDRYDFSWSKALSADEGMLSKSFVREFKEDAIEQAHVYSDMAASCFRHCSQFVHGKASVTSRLPQTVAYAEPVLSDWAETAKKAATAVLYLLYCRYAEELLPGDDKGALHSVIEHSFSHIPSVRTTIGLPA